MSHSQRGKQGRSSRPADSSLSLFLFKTLQWSGALPGYDPGCMTGREESALVAAEGREERGRERKKRRRLRLASWEWGCLISAGPSDGCDRAQAPIRQAD